MVLVGARANTASQMKTAFNTPQLTVGMIGNSVAQLIDQVQVSRIISSSYQWVNMLMQLN